MSCSAAEQGKGINAIPHSQSSPGKDRMAPVYPGRPGPILQPQFPKKSFQGVTTNFPDFLHNVSVRTAGEEPPPACQGARHPSPTCPCCSRHSAAIKCSMHFSRFSNCHKPTLWGFSDVLPVVPAERPPSSFPNLPWISEAQAAD